MTIAATALSGVTPLGGRVAPRRASRRVARGFALGVGTAGTAVVLTATAMMTAVWLVATARPDNLSSHIVTARGPGAMALAQFSPPPGKSLDRPTPVAVSNEPTNHTATTFNAKWALTAIPEPTNKQPQQLAFTLRSKNVRTKFAALTPPSA